MKNKLRSGYDFNVLVFWVFCCLYWILGIMEVNIPMHNIIATYTRGIFGAAAPIVPILSIVLVFYFIMAIESTCDAEAKLRWKRFINMFLWQGLMIVSVSTFFYILVNKNGLSSLHYAFAKGENSFYGGIIGYIGAKISLSLLSKHTALLIHLLIYFVSLFRVFRVKKSPKITKKEWKAFVKAFFHNPCRAVYEALKLEEN